MKKSLMLIGKIGNLECDFIIRKNSDYCYAQVSMSIMDEKVANREYQVFINIKDNYKKNLFTLDYLLQSRDGIINENMIEFMKDNKEL